MAFAFAPRMRKLRKQRELRWHILHAVYEDADIKAKLNLESIEETEQIVSKAIRDGVISAVINHDGGFMQSKEVSDIYATNDP